MEVKKGKTPRQRPRSAGTCKKCSKDFKYLYDHLRRCGKRIPEPKKFECNHCESKFPSKVKLLDHIMFRHLPQDENTNRCNKCQKTFASMSSARSHRMRCGKTAQQREDLKRFSCDHCTQKLCHKKALVKHIWGIHFKHERERFDCQQCGKSYASAALLKNHQKVCQKSAVEKYNQRKYCCDHCAFRATDISHIRKHILEKHMPKNQKYKCNVCDKSFNRPRFLSDHKKYAHEPKSYKCYKCGKELAGAHGLKMHTMYCNRSEAFKQTLHQYVCDICGYKARMKSQLRRHIIYNHQCKTAKCNRCKKFFGSSKALAVHSRYCKLQNN